MATSVKPIVSTHDYLSTACLHKLHERCRKSCKFCAAKCKCECHLGKLEDKEEEKVA